MASSAPVSDVKLHGRSDITWASTWASLNTGTETCSGRFITTGRDVAGVVEQVPFCCTNAFCCGGCPDSKFVTPELVEEFNKVCEENKNKKLLDMGLVCRAIYLELRGKDGTIPHLLVLVEDKGDYYRFDPTEPVDLCTVM
jgi:hypothetical protein